MHRGCRTLESGGEKRATTWQLQSEILMCAQLPDMLPHVKMLFFEKSFVSDVLKLASKSTVFRIYEANMLHFKSLRGFPLHHNTVGRYSLIGRQ